MDGFWGRSRILYLGFALLDLQKVKSLKTADNGSKIHIYGMFMYRLSYRQVAGEVDLHNLIIGRIIHKQLGR